MSMWISFLLSLRRKMVELLTQVWYKCPRKGRTSSKLKMLLMCSRRQLLRFFWSSSYKNNAVSCFSFTPNNILGTNSCCFRWSFVLSYSNGIIPLYILIYLWMWLSMGFNTNTSLSISHVCRACEMFCWFFLYCSWKHILIFLWKCCKCCRMLVWLVILYILYFSYLIYIFFHWYLIN